MISERNCQYFNIASKEDADVWLIGEEHRVASIKGELLSSLAKEAPITIFVEGISSMRAPSLSIKECKIISCIDETVPDENLSFIGWDYDDEALISLHIQIKSLEAVIERMGSQIEEMSKAISSHRLEIKKILPDYIENPMKIINLEASLRDQILSHSTAMRELSKELQEVYISQEESMARLKEVLELATGGSFRTRTESMVQTLQKIKEMQQNGSLIGKAIIVAGAAHLNPLFALEASKPYLDLLFQELQNHKAVIITLAF